LNSEKDIVIIEETQVEYRKYLEKYGREACWIMKWLGEYPIFFSIFQIFLLFNFPFFYIFHIISRIQKKSKSNSEKDMVIMEETQVKYRKYLEKYGRKACWKVRW
jgi:hypothetical protein